MTTPSTPIDYTSKDYASLRQAMLDDALVKLPSWTSRSENDFGVMLIEEFAYMGDILSWYIDVAANEAYLPTATLLQSVLNIAAMLDYRPASAMPSTVTLTFTAVAGTGTVLIPAGTQVQAQSPDPDLYPIIIFETNSDLYITQQSGNVTTGTVDATQGQTIAAEDIGTSDGTINQSFALAQNPVIDGSTVLMVAEGAQAAVIWTYVEHLIDTGPNDAVYTTATDSTGVTSIVFGDDVNGRVPVADADITCTYRIGGGLVTNVGPGTITQMVDASLTFLGSPPVTNLSAASGGTDAETIDQIRINAPLSLTTQQRAVTLQDYANLCLRSGGIAKASAMGLTYRDITVYVAPTGGGTADQTTKNALAQYLADKIMVGAQVIIADPTYVPVSITLSVYVGAAFSQTVVVNAVQNALLDLISFPNVTFGQTLSLSDVYSTVAAVPGVLSSQLSNLSRTTTGGVDDIVLDPNELLSLSGSTVNVTVSGGGIADSGVSVAPSPTTFFIPGEPGEPVVDSLSITDDTYVLQLHWSPADNASTYAVVVDFFSGSTYQGSERVGVTSVPSGSFNGVALGTSPDTMRIHVQSIDGPNVVDGPPVTLAYTGSGSGGGGGGGGGTPGPITGLSIIDFSPEANYATSETGSPFTGTGFVFTLGFDDAGDSTYYVVDVAYVDPVEGQFEIDQIGGPGDFTSSPLTAADSLPDHYGTQSYNQTGQRIAFRIGAYSATEGPVWSSWVETAPYGPYSETHP